MLLSALLWKRLNYKRMYLISLILLFYVVLVLLITRVHYIIDIIGGAIFALWIDRYVLPYVKYFDYFFTVIYRSTLSVCRYIIIACS